MARLCLGCMKYKNDSPVCEHCGYTEGTQNPQGFLPVGTVLQERYLIGKALGSIEDSQSYICMDLSTKEAVLIQEYLPILEFTNAITMDRQQRLLRNLYFTNQLRDISGIYGPEDYFEENDRSFLVSKYLEYTTLYAKIREKQTPYSATEVLLLLRPVMEALEKAHQRGIIHGRLSPENIVFDKEDQAMIFGDWLYDQDGVERRRGECYIIEPPFEAFEVHWGKVGPWTDVYGICAVIYYCLTGDKLTADLESKPPEWHLVQGLDLRQQNALHRGTHMQYQKRTQSMQQFMEDLFGEPFVRIDPFHGPGKYPLGGIPVDRVPSGAQVYIPEEKEKGIKKWLGKWKKNS